MHDDINQFKEEVTRTVREIVESIVALDGLTLPDSNDHDLTEDLDSLGVEEMAFRLEDEFHIEIGGNDIENLTTINKIVDVVLKKN